MKLIASLDIATEAPRWFEWCAEALIELISPD